jgi:ribonuclease HII
MSKHTTNEYEHHYWQQNKCLIGIDEAGRGPLAGPLVVAGVIFDKGYENDEIYDSKGISENKREHLFEIIKKDAKEYFIEIVEPCIIDDENIYRATQNAMDRIATKLNASVVLTDAMPLPNQSKEVVSLIKGDQKSISIAAASILAKVTRDRIMLEYDEQYPKYGFKRHKGYPTKEHLHALELYGALDIHRKSYGPVQRCLQMKLDI